MYNSEKGLFRFGFLLWIILFVSGNICNANEKLSVRRNRQTGNEKASEVLSNKGIVFTQNKGQVVDVRLQPRPDILYKANSGKGDIYLRKNAVSYVYVQSAAKDSGQENPKQNVSPEKLNVKVTGVRVDMEFVGANQNATVIEEQAAQSHSDYYNSRNKKEILNVGSFGKITYREIYKNTDIVFYGGKQNALKYDVILNAGADPGDVKFKYSGQESIKVEDGKLYIKTALGELQEYIPEIYQQENGRRKSISGKYILNDNTIGFEIKKYNKNIPLIIDPFVWITYYGGSVDDESYDISTDPSGNVLVSGYTTSLDFPVSAGAFQTTLTGSLDAFVVKLDPSGNRLWASYFGGTGAEWSRGVCSDPSGNVLIIGNTSSTDLPVTAGAFQSTLSSGSGQDIFIAKFDPSGNLLWATYYGGAKSDNGEDIATDNAGNVAFAGTTFSVDFPVSASAFQSSKAGFGLSSDGYIAELDANGNQLWSTYYGGSGIDYGMGVCTNASGNIGFIGYTGSTDIPVTAGAFQPALAGLSNDIYVSEFDGSGNQLWCTYYGGPSADDYGYSIVADPSGNFAITGGTKSYDFPVSAGAFQTASGGGIGVTYQWDAFLVKFDPLGNRLWGTYFGLNNTDEEAFGVASDASGNFYMLIDHGGLATVPTVGCSYQPNFLGGASYIAKFDGTGNLSCSTYIDKLGTVSDDFHQHGLAVYNKSIYFTLMDGAGAAVTPGAYQTVYGGGSDDAVIGRLCGLTCGDSPTDTVKITPPGISLCVGISYTFQGNYAAGACGGSALTYSWTFPNATPSSSTAQNPSGIKFSSAGNQHVKLVVDNGCGKDSSTVTVKTMFCVCSLLLFHSEIDDSCNGDHNGRIIFSSSGAGPTYSYSWSSSSGGSGSLITTATSDTLFNLAAGTYSVTVGDYSICAAAKGTITINEPPAIVFSANQQTPSTCGNSNGAAIASATGGNGTFTYTWSNGTSGQTNSGLATGTYTVTATDKKGCTSVQTVFINDLPGPSAAAIVSKAILCSGGSGDIAVATTGGTAPYIYSWSTGVSTVTTLLNDTLKGVAANTYVVTITDNNGCTVTTTATLTDPPAINITSLVPVDATCGNPDGSASVTASGGTGGLVFTWSNGQTGVTATGLSGGVTYTLTITDGSGCTKTSSVTINNANGPTAALTVNSAINCNGGTGSIIVSVSSGVSPYTYDWSTGVTAITTAVTQQLNSLPANTYVVTVADASGCTNVASVNLTQPSAVTVNSISTTSSTCEKNNGTATAFAAGGTGALTYSWSNTAVVSTATGLTGGLTYTVTITDGNNCPSSSTVTINTIAAPVVTLNNSTAILCKGGTGNITAMVSGGTANYTYGWSTGSSSVTSVLSNTLTAISSNTYFITITDANGCTAVSSIDLTEPSQVLINNITTNNATCNSANGSAVAASSGGTGGLTYSWSSGGTSAAENNLGAGVYVLTVADANGCSAMSTAIVGSVSGPTVTAVVATMINCNGGTGSVSSIVSGGTGPYTYSWSGSGGSGSTASGLSAGNYTVTITDASGCSVSSVVDLTQPTKLMSTLSVTDASCGIANGSVTVNVTGGTSAFSYSWNTGINSVTSDSTFQITGLAAGSYSVLVTDKNGCTTIDSGSVNNVNNAKAAVSATQTSITEGNSVLLFGSGGVNYLWSPASTLSCSACPNPLAAPTTTTTYWLLVSDGNGCKDSADITITVKRACTDNKDIFIANVFSPNNDGKNDVLNIEGNGLSNIYWAIYDRWGNLLFDTTDQSEGWDGTKKGSAMDPGTYVYYLKAICVKTNKEILLKGNVSVIK